METLGRADRGQVPVTLIRKDEVFRPHPLDPRGHGRAAAVGRLQGVEIEVIVDEHAASCRGNANGFPAQFHFFDHLCEQAGHDGVAAPRAIVEVGLLQEPGSGIDFLHSFFPLTDW